MVHLVTPCPRDLSPPSVQASGRAGLDPPPSREVLPEGCDGASRATSWGAGSAWPPPGGHRLMAARGCRTGGTQGGKGKHREPHGPGWVWNQGQGPELQTVM